MEIPFSASKMEKKNKEQENSINAPDLEGSASTSSPGRGTWDRLPDLVQETIVKMVDERKTLLTCRLVNTAWKEVADKTLENQSICEWTKWNPFVESNFHSSLPKMELIPDWNMTSTLGMKWNHSSLPIIVNQKLKSPFPTNSMQMQMDACEEDNSDEPIQWPPTCKKGNRIRMARAMFSSYGNFLTCFSLSDFKTSFEALCGILSDMSNVKALELTNVKMEMTTPESSEEEHEVEEEDVSSPLQNLPSLPNLLHVKILNCDSRVSQQIINSYSAQITTLESTACINSVSQPFPNLTQFKLDNTDSDEEPNHPFLQLGPSSFPSLQYFSFIYLHDRIELKEFIQVVDNLPKTLVDFHLEVAIGLKDYMNIRNLAKNMSTFPSIQKLGIRFPRNNLHTEMVEKWLLPRFPNVNVLNLTYYPFQYDHIDGEEVTRDDEGTINNVVDTVAAGFWSACSELEKIFVYRDGSEVLRDLRRDVNM